MPTSKTFQGVALNGNMGGVALTTSEEAITIAAPSPARGSAPQMTVFSDVAWYYDSAPGAADGLRIPFAAGRALALNFNVDSLTFYAKTQSGGGTLFLMRTG